MELRLLRYFWTVATVGTVSQAAEQLFITQPTLSRQIHELELELDTPLFIRDGRKLVLTEDGQYLKNKAEEILSLADQTTEVFLNRKNEALVGNLTIGALEGFVADDIAVALAQLLKANPQITFTILSGNADEIKQKLDAGLVDVGFLIEPVSSEKYSVERLDVTESWLLMTQKDNPLAAKKAIRYDDIKDEPLIISHRAEVRRFFAEWAKCKLEDFHFIGGFNLGFNLFPLVDEGIGSAIVTEGAMRRGFPDLVTIPLEPEVKTHSVLVWKKNAPLSPVTRAFIKQYLYE